MTGYHSTSCVGSVLVYLHSAHNVAKDVVHFGWNFAYVVNPSGRYICSIAAFQTLNDQPITAIMFPFILLQQNPNGKFICDFK